MLAEYLRVTQSLSDLHTTTTFPSLEGMVDVMLNHIKVYQKEALASDIVILATVLNPKYRLRFFEQHYPEHAGHAKNLIETAFESTLENWPVTPASTPAPAPASGSKDPFDNFDMFTSSATFETSESVRAGELDSYLQGSNLIVPGQSELAWWKVCFP